jgi:hypothetical protein
VKPLFGGYVHLWWTGVQQPYVLADGGWWWAQKNNGNSPAKYMNILCEINHEPTYFPYNLYVNGKICL